MSRSCRRAAVAALLTAAMGSTVACGGETPGSVTAGPPGREYRPGLEVRPHVPASVTRAPVVVMVPGGGWVTADPTGLEPLAVALADAGLVAVPVTVRAAADGVTYPVPVEDVLCALAAGVAAAREAGVEPESVVLLGHSSGAHLAAVAALAPDSVRPGCRDPLVDADALVGLAGPYDVRRFAEAAEPLFGGPPEQDPATWASANPLLLAHRRPGMPVLLLHGDADDVVPVTSSRAFAAALEAGGHRVRLTVVPGADHDGIYSAEVAAPSVTAWVRTVSP